MEEPAAQFPPNHLLATSSFLFSVRWIQIHYVNDMAWVLPVELQQAKAR
ncbi:MAG: hypothetical protein HYW48_02680 [Deltaproteobacteria bacterium]|nr:hypothetical protein [Deltaproteobacteria bacterium]